MMKTYSLGYSPCPNDTYVFYALVHRTVPDAPAVRKVLEDIATLNRMAVDGRLDITKISFHAFAHLRDRYCLLHSGGALGRGCGPLVVAREPMDPQGLTGKRIAIPGRLTTAALLLRLHNPGLQDLVVLPFHRIMEAVRSGDADAGVLIHEGRFTFPAYGLCEIIDLGQWWEEVTGHPTPLGGILARRDLGRRTIEWIDRSLKASVEYAHANAEAILPYVRRHAQEMDEGVMHRHIDLYVNQYTLDYGADGEAAIADLLSRAERSGIVPPSGQSLFADDPGNPDPA